MTSIAWTETTVAELRKLAARHGVAGASRLRRAELEQALAAKLGVAPPASDGLPAELTGRPVLALRRMALDHGVRGAARMNRETLVDILKPLLTGESQASATGAEPVQAPPPAPTETAYHFPESYGVDRVVLLVRDPEWLYCYWDVSGDTWAMLIQRGLTNPAKGWRRVLRVHDVTTTDDGLVTDDTWLLDLEPGDDARDWYFRAPRQDRLLLVEFGYLAPSGEFLCIARSNVAQVPRRAPSEDRDETWASLSDQAYRLSLAGGDPTHAVGSAEASRKLEAYLAEGLSSGLFLRQPGAVGADS